MFRKGKNVFACLAVAITVIGLVFATVQSKKANDVVAEAVTTTPTQAFINEIGGTASQIAQEHDLYASVMIAQAILESASGQSGLSQAPHYNFFGIKGSYNGGSILMKTWEDDGTGRAYEVDQPFRVYPSIYASLSDYANLLGSDLYAGVRKSNTLSYQDATAALTGLYATDTSYNTKLNSIIQNYGLTAYDTGAQANSKLQVGANASEPTQAAVVKKVWNHYRKAYTDEQTLQIDEAWAQRYPTGY
ncbi:glycoside hydrolase family 73 protein [Streptococcus halichoeri]|uniref:glycoside hydrolase family 73 protein n=1 Tax=Streptococcus halichoeri TaxID=254785 RepID=UPI00135A0789|nr:glycoside hydrolase family 73 protein [Streptococcus halichoeri]